MWFTIAQAAALALVLAVLYRPLGDYMAQVYTSTRDTKVERGLYRVIGVNPAAAQTWQAYARSVVAFSLVGVLQRGPHERVETVARLLQLPTPAQRPRRTPTHHPVSTRNWLSTADM